MQAAAVDQLSLFTLCTSRKSHAALEYQGKPNSSDAGCELHPRGAAEAALCLNNMHVVNLDIGRLAAPCKE